MTKIITICGPTGIGKTGFAIALARELNGEIIGADSMQIYKYMDVGTAKPDERERQLAIHHLVDFLDPADNFDAKRFTTLADQAISGIAKRGRVPVVAGGTGLYIRALIHGLFRGRAACPTTLNQLNQTLEEKGGRALHEQLAECDPKAAEQIHPNDGFRIVRALEVFLTTGIPISKCRQTHDFKSDRYQSLTFGLHMDRKLLYDRINQRVDIMMAQGLLDEVKSLVNQGYSLELKSMQSIGYRHMGMYIKGEVSLEEAVRLLKRDTRRYAKRQFTWFNKEKNLIWIDTKEIKKAIETAKDFLR
ncbi:tRNA (adenosine(37)-N6)-dimethylallyltransferase MiaA [Desulfobacter hydrogenophilus]|uniref:tRNA dimethylallyltransferase n=1 Tax=Desulfobacter hydrogenophilus TaxID=2291 RepID=A0A328FCS7_9BACT|nr:tRNA (adenosine(37)-N6)-dimethylallyltransferase MiaA [Desulfobacter hydrogenophilus]NDY71640.1 tRNA (adenosine(37)-N6)-dimethylallyltransferase MiaA [Desulfobacter hydrogenophilus]QBH15417.1 tRNA (adenosine(37)-N6)-dimethylallyltransferase MiaA [Desulfobacter hydrogenophilus]RAM02494.1 tRNA (adenosine(37)-N6)-dimethylallyltransferase MiaA [Desulfobacter hydrogenophilus]